MTTVWPFTGRCPISKFLHRKRACIHAHSQSDCIIPSISASSSGLRPDGSALASVAGMPIICRAALVTATRTPQSPPPTSLRLRRLAIAAPARASRIRLYSVASYAGGSDNQLAQPPFRFETGIGLFAKRAPRPFPPPFTSPPSASFSDPLSTHHQSRDRRAFVNGELIKGYTNGDDAVYASDFFICTNDGVGAWATRPRGHAGYVYGLGVPSLLKKPVDANYLWIDCGLD